MKLPQPRQVLVLLVREVFRAARGRSATSRAIALVLCCTAAACVLSCVLGAVIYFAAGEHTVSLSWSTVYEFVQYPLGVGLAATTVTALIGLKRAKARVDLMLRGSSDDVSDRPAKRSKKDSRPKGKNGDKPSKKKTKKSGRKTRDGKR